MSATLVSSNFTLKVNRALSGGETISSGCYGVCDYTMVNTNANPAVANMPVAGFIRRYYGPGQVASASINVAFQIGSTATIPTTASYSVASGVEFINSP